jgi:hypothetical protein
MTMVTTFIIKSITLLSIFQRVASKDSLPPFPKPHHKRHPDITMAESFFTRVANDVLEATEKISNELEASFSAIFSGGDDQEKPPAEDTIQEDESGEIEEEFRHNPLEGIAESVLGDILEGQRAPSGPVGHFNAFRHAITWSEPFILSLVTFQIFMLLACLWVSRKNRSMAPRLVVMVFIGITVRMAERLNRLGAKHWQSFSTQNYFDRRGFFVSIMLCSPLMMDCLIMVFCYLREAVQLLVQVKATQIRQQRRQQAKEEESKKDK